MIYSRSAEGAPKHAVSIPGRGRHYVHSRTGEQWISITNVLDMAVSKQALVPWAAKITAQKAWAELPRMVATSRKPVEREALAKEIKGEVRIVKDMAADLGSRVHSIVEADVLGKPRPEDPEAEPYARQALRFFHDWGVSFEKDIEATEATVINRTVGYAGTGDVWVWLRINGQRRLLVVDYKTSQTRPADSVFPEMGMQVAAIAHGEVVLLDDGTEVPPPGPIHGTAILNLRANSYALMPMPLKGTMQQAFHAFCGALQDAVWLHEQYGAKQEPLKPPLRAVS